MSKSIFIAGTTNSIFGKEKEIILEELEKQYKKKKYPKIYERIQEIEEDRDTLETYYMEINLVYNLSLLEFLNQKPVIVIGRFRGTELGEEETPIQNPDLIKVALILKSNNWGIKEIKDIAKQGEVPEGKIIIKGRELYITTNVHYEEGITYKLRIAKGEEGANAHNIINFLNLYVIYLQNENKGYYLKQIEENQKKAEKLLKEQTIPMGTEYRKILRELPQSEKDNIINSISYKVDNYFF